MTDIIRRMKNFRVTNRLIIIKLFTHFMYNNKGLLRTFCVVFDNLTKVKSQKSKVKKIKLQNAYLYLILLIFFPGCKKDSINFPVEPKIDFVSISPSTAMQYTDKVNITIHYEDGDGDLGENKDGVKNCFVTDN